MATQTNGTKSGFNIGTSLPFILILFTVFFLTLQVPFYFYVKDIVYKSDAIDGLNFIAVGWSIIPLISFGLAVLVSRFANRNNGKNKQEAIINSGSAFGVNMPILLILFVLFLLVSQIPFYKYFTGDLYEMQPLQGGFTDVNSIYLLVLAWLTTSLFSLGLAYLISKLIVIRSLTASLYVKANIPIFLPGILAVLFGGGSALAINLYINRFVYCDGCYGSRTLMSRYFTGPETVIPIVAGLILAYIVTRVLVKRYSIKWAHPLIGILVYLFTLTMITLYVYGVATTNTLIQILTLLVLLSEVIFSYINYRMYRKSLGKTSN